MVLNTQQVLLLLFVVILVGIVAIILSGRK